MDEDRNTRGDSEMEGVKLRVVASLVALGMGIAALVVAILLVRGVLG
jgi:hypothetical protein